MKILLIGNKTDIPDKTKDIEKLSPDIVVRYNKCDSWEKTKTSKTDIWLMDIWGDMLEEQFDRIPKECLDSMHQILFFSKNFNNTSSRVIEKFSNGNKLTIISYDDIPIVKYFPMYDFMKYRPTNFLWMIIYCLEKLDGELYVTAADIKDRSFLMDEIDHKSIYKYEEELLKKLIEEGKIHVI